MSSRGEYYDGGYRRVKRRREKQTRKRSAGMMLLDGVVLLLSVLAGVALVLTLLAPYIHPEKFWMFPVLGLVAPAVYVGVVLLTLYWIIRWRWMVAAPLLVLLVVGLFKMPLFLKPQLRRTYDTEQRFGAGTITLMTYNVRNFYDDNKRWSCARVAELVRRVDPDIVCLQEFSRTAAEAAELDTLLTGYTRACLPGRDFFYSAVYTKYRVLGEPAPILKGSRDDGQSVQVDLRMGDDTLRIINNHLHSTAIKERDDQYLIHTQFLTDTAGGRQLKNIFQRFRNTGIVRARQADTIARAVARARVPLIVCGDFNDTPMSYVYRRMSRGLSDAFSERGRGYSHTFRGFMDALRIDYVLFGKPLECLSYEVLEDVELSDHHPVVVRLKVKS